MLLIRNLNISNEYIKLKSSFPLSFNSGEISFIKGQSGTGKTTLLYILGLISSNEDYEYVYQNKLINSSKNRDKIKKNEIGFLYQNFNLLEDMSLYSCMEMFASMNNTEIDKKKAEQLLTRFNLALDLNRKFKTLSGGEKQRFCLVCILAKNPKVIIADEPTSALDKDNAELMMNLLHKLAKEYKKMVIISTHTSEYDDMADVIYHIEKHEVQIIKSKQNRDINILSSQIKQGNSNIKFYIDLLKYQVLQLLKNYKFLMLLSVVIVCLGIFLVGYSHASEENYLELLNNSIKNEAILSVTTNLDNSDLDLIRNIQGVTDIQPLYMRQGTLVSHNQKEYEVSIFPGSGEETYLSSNLLSEKNELVTINNTVYKVNGFISDYQINLYSNEPVNFVAIIPSYNFDYQNVEFDNKYIITMTSFEQYAVIKERIELMFSGSNMDSTFSQIQSLLQGFESNKLYIYSAVIILIIISFILLNLIQLYEVKARKKDLCIFQANGMTKTELIVVELIRILIVFCGYLFFSVLGLLLMSNIANKFLLGSAKIIINADVLKMLVCILNVDILMPSALYAYLAIKAKIENTIRSNVI